MESTDFVRRPQEASAARTRITLIAVTLIVMANGLIAAPAALAQDYVPKSLLATEMRDISALTTALDQLDRVAAALERKAQISKSEIDSAQAEADAVKQALPQFQRALSSVINKLQAAGKWTPELDAFVEGRLKARGASASVQQEFKRLGGARGVFQYLAAIGGDVTRAVDADVAALRRKGVVNRLLDELLGTPVHAGLIKMIQAVACRAVDGICITWDLDCTCRPA
jgi:hypothetical protein